MSGVIDSLERAQLRKVPAFEAGDRVKVHFQVIEGNRRRTQVFEGIVIKRQGKGARETFTVRKQSFGVGVERTFPVHSPKIERIEVAARGDVRRAKLYYLRGRVGRRARVRERQYTGAVGEPEALDAQGAQDEAPVLSEEQAPDQAEETTAEAPAEAPAADTADDSAPADADGDVAVAEVEGEGAADDTAKASDPAASADSDAEGAGDDAADSESAEDAPAESDDS